MKALYSCAFYKDADGHEDSVSHTVPNMKILRAIRPDGGLQKLMTLLESEYAESFGPAKEILAAICGADEVERKSLSDGRVQDLIGHVSRVVEADWIGPPTIRTSTPPGTPNKAQVRAIRHASYC